MTILPQGFAAIGAFTARLLGQSREPDHLQKRASAPERLEAGARDAERLPPGSSADGVDPDCVDPDCVDPGPAGFDFSDAELRRVLSRNHDPQK